LIKTQRTDKWWVEPLWTGLGFLGFVVYTTWAMFQGNHYWWSAGMEGFGSWPGWWPSLIPSTPAILIFAGPLSFRMTCYYYSGESVGVD